MGPSQLDLLESLCQRRLNEAIELVHHCLANQHFIQRATMRQIATQIKQLYLDFM